MYLCSDQAVQRHRGPAPDRRRVRRQMTGSRSSSSTRIGSVGSSTWQATSRAGTVATTTADPYPIWHDFGSGRPSTRERSTSCRASTRTCCSTGCRTRTGPHFSAFIWAACDAAYRNPETFASSAEAVDLEDWRAEVRPTACCRWGAPSTAVTGRSCSRPSRPTKVQWWVENWIENTVHALIDSFEKAGRAELNVEFCAAIPVLTITGSFGLPVDQALDVRESLESARTDHGDARRRSWRPAANSPADDLISVLVEAEITDEDGETAPAHRRRDLLVRPPPARGRLGHDLEADGHHAGRSAPAARAPRRRSGRPEPAALGDRGVGAVGTDGPDVLALGDRGHWISSASISRRDRCSTSASARPTAIRSAGSVPTSSTRSRTNAADAWPSAAVRTSASASTWPEPR